MGLFDSIFGFVGNIIKPVTELVDSVSTTDEEKAQLKNELAKIEAELTKELVTYKTKLLEAQASVITAEAKGESWLQRNWRPITMLTFVVLIVARWMGLTIEGISPQIEKQLYDIVQIGLGGYVIGRSAEKIVPSIAGAIKERNISATK